MKTLISIIVILFAVGCGKTETKTEPLSLEKLVGTFEARIEEDAVKIVLLENGQVELYFNREKKDEGKWKIVGNEVHGVFGQETGLETAVFKIDPNDDLTEIAYILDGKRTKLPNEDQTIFKRLKE